MTSDTNISPKPAGKGCALSLVGLLVSGILLLLLYLFMIAIFFMNLIDGDSNILRYTFCLAGSLIGIAGIVLLLIRRLWGLLGLLGALVGYCTGMGKELYQEEGVILLVLILLLSFCVAAAACLYERRESGVPFKLTRRHLLALLLPVIVVVAVYLCRPIPKYDFINYEQDGFRSAKLHKTGKLGLLNAADEEVIPCIYDDLRQYLVYVHHAEASTLIVVTKDGKLTTLDTLGQQIAPQWYDEIDYEAHKPMRTHIGDKVGYINLDGTELIPCQYTYLKPCNDTVYIAKIDDKYGAIRPDGSNILPYAYDAISYERQGLVATLDGVKTTFSFAGNDITALLPAEKPKLRATYDAQTRRFVFKDLKTGEVLKYKRLTAGGRVPEAVEYEHSSEHGGMIKFIWDRGEVLSREGNVTTYGPSSSSSYSISGSMHYSLSDGILDIDR